MSPFGSSLLLLPCAILLGLSQAVSAQTLRLKVQPPTENSAASEPQWPADIRYSIATDYLDTRTPRGYTNSLFGSLGYRINDKWSVNSELGVRAELINGKIDKGPEQGNIEALNPSTSFELDFEHKLFTNHGYTLFTHGEPLWDAASQLEGYKGLIGAGGGVTFNFFDKRYSMSHVIDTTELLNTFHYGSDLSANPDYFVTYKLVNSLRLWSTYKLSYAFGLKTTRYLDGFWGYAYDNSFTLSKSWEKVTVALSYDNGGFTDDGELLLWYIDQYRRVAHLSVNYAF